MIKTVVISGKQYEAEINKTQDGVMVGISRMYFDGNDEVESTQRVETLFSVAELKNMRDDIELFLQAVDSQLQVSKQL